MVYNILIVILLTLLPANLVASTVTDVSVADSILTITGTGLGTRSDYGGAEDQLPYLWETFDNGYVTNPKLTYGHATLDTSNLRTGSSANLKHQELTPDVDYTNYLGATVTRSARYMCGGSVAGLSPNSEYFTSGWFATENIDEVLDNISNQFKTLDVSTNNASYKTYFNIEGYAGYVRYSQAIESSTAGSDVAVSISAPDGTWHRFDIYYSSPTLVNGYTDVVKFWIDGRLAYTGQLVGHLWPTNADVEPVTGIFHNNWINNTSNTGQYMLSDDFFIDFTQARVELSESSTWDDTVQVHKEIQIPTVWTDTSITADLNQGSFADTDTVYAYVIDDDGNVSDADSGTVGIQGFAITLDGSSEGSTNVHASGGSVAASGGSVSVTIQ